MHQCVKDTFNVSGLRNVKLPISRLRVRLIIWANVMKAFYVSYGIYTFLSVFVFLLYDYQAMPVVKINRAFPDALCFNHLLLWHEKSTLTYYWLKCFVKQLLNYLSVRQT